MVGIIRIVLIVLLIFAVIRIATRLFKAYKSRQPDMIEVEAEVVDSKQNVAPDATKQDDK